MQKLSLSQKCWRFLRDSILLEHCVVPSTLLPTNLPREGSRNFQLIGLILVDLGGLCNLVFLSWHVNRRFDCKTNVSRRHHAIDKKPTNYGFLYNEQSFPTHLCVCKLLNPWDVYFFDGPVASELRIIVALRKKRFALNLML